jgi:DNA adenine methylase
VTMRRPLLRYHGGKWMLAPWIIEHFPPHRIYVEPFGGAASVLLRKERSYAEVWNDLDCEVVNLFRVVREKPAALTRALVWTPWSRAEFELARRPTRNRLERARRFMVRAMMGFGTSGLLRGGRTGFRAAPYRISNSGVHDWVNHPPTLRAVARRLRGVTIEQRPALDVIAQQDGPDTLFYVDPPYTHAERVSVADGHRAYVHEMDDAAHEKLADVLRSAHGMVLLSGYRSALYARLYRDWRSVQCQTLANGGRKRTEVLWINPAAEHALAANTGPLFAAAGGTTR